MAILCHTSLNLLKSETEHKLGIKIKQQMTVQYSNYLLKVFTIVLMRCPDYQGITLPCQSI
jgi:hypothetical protein